MKFLQDFSWSLFDIYMGLLSKGGAGWLQEELTIHYKSMKEKQKGIFPYQMFAATSIIDIIVIMFRAFFHMEI